MNGYYSYEMPESTEKKFREDLLRSHGHTPPAWERHKMKNDHVPQYVMCLCSMQEQLNRIKDTMAVEVHEADEMLDSIDDFRDINGKDRSLEIGIARSRVRSMRVNLIALGRLIEDIHDLTTWAWHTWQYDPVVIQHSIREAVKNIPKPEEGGGEPTDTRRAKLASVTRED